VFKALTDFTNGCLIIIQRDRVSFECRLDETVPERNTPLHIVAFLSPEIWVTTSPLSHSVCFASSLMRSLSSLLIFWAMSGKAEPHGWGEAAGRGAPGKAEPGRQHIEAGKGRRAWMVWAWATSEEAGLKSMIQNFDYYFSSNIIYKMYQMY
jgi:hypothetical protein